MNEGVSISCYLLDDGIPFWILRGLFVRFDLVDIFEGDWWFLYYHSMPDFCYDTTLPIKHSHSREHAACNPIRRRRNRYI